ncbi:hypothetical protein Ae717Ps2_7113 [Pseudonocardia sp. Ae717_Ps2]|uniref:hypothetical protein n=1 Tax=Pseudonocardia sp. Ae717_Ps2 TaxID=1885573 RepID=UPI00094B014E|nr:hypothetical protein [Pseudonocardia sp. Ae717_Ps2]OLM27895.1 hypothetical protein Ae717Ps2_7113 [Pseudonocardia sp. Ae717_Ps2]
MSTTDWAAARVERQRAAADAEERRARAESIREETAARRAERAAATVTQRRVDRQVAQQGRRDLWRARGVAGRRSAPAVAGLVACAAPTLIATSGQYQFGKDVMHLPGLLPALVPLMLEGAAWLLAWRRHQAERAGQPAGSLAAGMWTIALTAAGLNLSHYLPNWQVGTVFAVASLVGFGLVELLSQHERTARADGLRRRRRLTGLARAARFPIVSWRAWSRRLQLGPTSADPIVDADAAWNHAWTLTRAGMLEVEVVDALLCEVEAAATTAAERDQALADVAAERDRAVGEVAAVRGELVEREQSLLAAAEQAHVRLAAAGEELEHLKQAHDQVLTEAAALRSELDRPGANAVGEQPGPSTEHSGRGTERALDSEGFEPELVEAGRAIAERMHLEEGRRISRSALISGLRAAGHAIGTDRASALLAVLHEDLDSATSRQDRVQNSKQIGQQNCESAAIEAGSEAA